MLWTFCFFVWVFTCFTYVCKVGVQTIQNSWMCRNLGAQPRFPVDWHLRCIYFYFYTALNPGQARTFPIISVSPLGNRDSLVNNSFLEKEMATHSSILAWKSPWTEHPGRLQSMGLHDWACVHEGGGRWVGSNKVVELKKKKNTHTHKTHSLGTTPEFKLNYTQAAFWYPALLATFSCAQASLCSS